MHEDIHSLALETGHAWGENVHEEGYEFEIEVFGRIANLKDMKKLIEEVGNGNSSVFSGDKTTPTGSDITGFFNDFSNLEEGTYEWNGKAFVKVD